MDSNLKKPRCVGCNQVKPANSGLINFASGPDYRSDYNKQGVAYRLDDKPTFTLAPTVYPLFTATINQPSYVAVDKDGKRIESSIVGPVRSIDEVYKTSMEGEERKKQATSWRIYGMRLPWSTETSK